MSSVRDYHHNDPGAPVLTGTVGSLIALLRACLVDGYGSGEHAKPGLGWETLYSAANHKAAFRSTDPASGRLWLYVNDAGPGAGGGREARWFGYETLGGLDGSGNPQTPGPRFPTAAQSANGVFVCKSVATDTVARSWSLVGDGRLFYLSVDTGSSNQSPWHRDIYAFGDLVSFAPIDPFGCFLAARVAENAGTGSSISTLNHMGASSSAPHAGHFMARGSEVFSPGCYKIVGQPASGAMGHGGPAFPNPVDSGLHLSPILVATADSVRGRLPGLYAPIHIRPLPHGTAVRCLGGGVLAGRLLWSSSVAVSIAVGEAGAGRLLFDITGPWR